MPASTWSITWQQCMESCRYGPKASNNVHIKHQNGGEMLCLWFWHWHGWWFQWGWFELFYLYMCWSPGNLDLDTIREYKQKIRLVWADKKPAVTRIITRYHCGEHKSVSECTIHWTVRRISYNSRRPGSTGHRIALGRGRTGDPQHTCVPVTYENCNAIISSWTRIAKKCF